MSTLDPFVYYMELFYSSPDAQTHVDVSETFC